MGKHAIAIRTEVILQDCIGADACTIMDRVPLRRYVKEQPPNPPAINDHFKQRYREQRERANNKN